VAHSPSKDELDSQFNLRARHPDFQTYFDRNESLSNASLSRFSWRTDIPYGDLPLQTLDTVAAQSPNSPIFFFIHGGYWKTLDKRSHRFLANPFLENGCAAVNVNYRLAPEVSIDDIVNDVARAIRWTYAHAHEFHGDSNRIYIAGHSAGAHLALMSYLRLLEQEESIAKAIRCAYCVSGLYDLESLMRSYLNAELNLTPRIAKTCSPLARAALNVSAPLRFPVGSEETDVFVYQTRLIHELAKISGADTSTSFIEGRHHFDILYELGDAKGRLCEELLSIVKTEQSA
jgi:arylformamidase